MPQALAISSGSNIDKVNHAKVLKRYSKFSPNAEFLEVACRSTSSEKLRKLVM